MKWNRIRPVATTPDDPGPEEPGLADREAVDRLMVEVYDELRRLAGKYLSAEAGTLTLQPTSLVHEAYLRMLEQNRVAWRNRSHFFLVAAQMMRRVLVDHFRARRTKKRGGEQVRLTLVEVAGPEPQEIDLLGLDRALTSLQALDRRQATIVELRYFAGLSVEETAQALGVSTPTVKREWAAARAWLLVEMEGAPPPDHGP